MKKAIAVILAVIAMCTVLTSCRESPALTRAAEQYSDLFDVYGEDLESMSEEEIMAALEETGTDESTDILN